MPGPTTETKIPSAPGHSCCSASSNNGALVSFGYAAADISSGNGEQLYQMWFATNGVDKMSVLFFPNIEGQSFVNYPGSLSQTAQAGYIITSTAGTQHMTSWFTNFQRGIWCQNKTAPSPYKIVPGFNSCPGASDSLYGNAASSTFHYPSWASPNPSNFLTYQVSETPTQAAAFIGVFLNKGNGVCELTSHISSNPFNAFVFSFTPFYAASPPPAPEFQQYNFFTPPPACG